MSKEEIIGLVLKKIYSFQHYSNIDNSLIFDATGPNFHLVIVSLVHIDLLIFGLFFYFLPLFFCKKFFHGQFDFTIELDPVNYF